MANIMDVAKRAKVSPMTVSRVLNQSGYVKEETKQRILQAMEEVNYIPNGLARSLVKQKSMTLALIVPDITNPFFTTVARGTEDMARKSGYRVILCNSDEDLKKEQEYVEMCLSIRVDGIIIAAAGDRSAASLEKIKKHNIPFVCIDREVAGVDADFIVGDNAAAARTLTQHLIDLGHRRIAMISGPFSVSTSRERIQGYQEALASNNIPFLPEYLIETSYNQRADLQFVDVMRAWQTPPTAIFAANNFVGAQVFRGLRNMNLRVPEDVAIVTFDEMEALFITEPFLTSALQPAYNFGSLAIQLLMERMDGAAIKQPRRIVLAADIAIRRSTAVT